MELNHRPPAYEAGVLTDWTTRTYIDVVQLSLRGAHQAPTTISTKNHNQKSDSIVSSSTPDFSATRYREHT